MDRAEWGSGLLSIGKRGKIKGIIGHFVEKH